MRGKIAKQLRKFAAEDAKELPDVTYTNVVTGQDYKRAKGLPLNETRYLGQCCRAYYQQLKHIWKNFR